jgi:hypothetical protein
VLNDKYKPLLRSTPIQTQQQKSQTEYLLIEDETHHVSIWSTSVHGITEPNFIMIDRIQGAKPTGSVPINSGYAQNVSGTICMYETSLMNKRYSARVHIDSHARTNHIDSAQWHTRQHKIPNLKNNRHPKYDQHTCKSARFLSHTHINTNFNTWFQTQSMTSPKSLATSRSGSNPVSAQVCGVCACVCVRVSMLNIGHCNRQRSDITNCTERSGREAVGREYTENDLSITLLMAIHDGGAGVVVGAHGASASASTIAMCETHSDGGLFGPEARIWPRSAVFCLSRAVQLGLAVSELQSERRERRTWRRPRPTCSLTPFPRLPPGLLVRLRLLRASLLPLRHCRTFCKPQTRRSRQENLVFPLPPRK